MKKLVCMAVTIAIVAVIGAPFILHAQEVVEEETALVPETPSRAETGNAKLLRAYRKEFAFLENEKALLEKRIAETSAALEGKGREAEAETNRLQRRYLSLTDDVDRASERLKDVEGYVMDIEETAEVLDSTIGQATLTLEGYDVEAPDLAGADVEARREAVEFLFSRATSILKDLAGIRKTEGVFFLNDGSRAEGTLIHVGNVASFGVSEAGSGTLAPAGEGHLKLWNQETGPAAKAIDEGEAPSTLPLYLYESLDKMAEHGKAKTTGEVVESGGVIAYIIVALGLVALAMILARTFFLWNSGSNTSRLVDEVTPLVEKGDMDRALQGCKASKGASARVLAATIRHLDTDPDTLEDIISESILHETPYLERFESAIIVFAAVAPLLGLLGTVTGMISTFDVITEYGTGDPKLLSGGISEALVTTQLGLIVAIPALLLGNLLSGWSERIKSGMENAALRVTNIAKGFKTEKMAA